MAIEISANSNRPPHGAIESSNSASAFPTSQTVQRGGGQGTGSPSSDQFQLSNQAAQLHALEAEIANLPVVDPQRVQDVQRTVATGSLHIEPARVADKLLTFEAGLGKA